MFDRLISYPFSIFTNRADADALVARFIADGAAEAEYRVVENAGGRFVVSFFDEAGVFVGNV